MKTMMLATASALLFATAASAGERIQLSETQLDNLTAGAIFGLALGGNLGGGAGNGAGSTAKYSAKNINRVTSKTTTGGTGGTSFSDEVYSEQTHSAEGAGGAGALALGLQAGVAVYLSTP